MRFCVERFPHSLGHQISASTIDAPEFGALLWNGRWGVEEFAHADKGWPKLMLARALPVVGLEGARGRMKVCGDVMEFVVFGSRDRVFLFPAEPVCLWGE